MSMKHDIVHQALSGITDRDTIKSYKSSIGEFCSWAKNEQGITKLKDLKGRRTEIINETKQSYVFPCQITWQRYQHRNRRSR